MALVGDAIVEAREECADPCQTIAAIPSGITVTAVTNASGVLAAGTYYIQVTLVNLWGESLPSNEQSVVVGGGGTNAISVSLPFTLPLVGQNLVSFKVYLATAAGAEASSFLNYGIGSPLIITNLPNAISSAGIGLVSTPGTPPIRSSAWLPDTDGSFVSAATMYRWLNDGLSKMGRIAGGIPGITAVQAVAGQAMYRIPGRWIRMTNFWFDGWPLSAGKRGDIFLHNTVSGVSGLATIEEWTDQTLVQIWPQPNRTGNVTNLTANLGTTDTNITVASTAGFLPLGLALVTGVPINYVGLATGSNQVQNELVVYTGTDPTHLQNAVLGVGGTSILGFPANSTLVYEANLRFAGFRQPGVFTLGQSSLSLGLPLGWDVPLSDYLVAQYRAAEQQREDAQSLEKEFEADVKELAASARGKTGPIQIGSITREVYPGGFGGGVLIP